MSQLWAFLSVFVCCYHHAILQSVDCPRTIGDLKVLENPVNVPKTANRKITTLQIREEQHLGSLTCHVLRDTSNSLFDKFNATTTGLAFPNPSVYDPYAFGQKQQRFYNCDIYLTNDNFEENQVNLEVVLILQPLLRRQGLSICDVPLITRRTVRIEFEGYKEKTTRQPFVFTTILRRKIEIEKASSSRSPLTTSTKRQPKVVPQFASSTSKSLSSSIDSENPRNNDDNDKYLVDGFVVHKPAAPAPQDNSEDYNTIDKDSKPLRPDSEPSISGIPRRPDEKDKTNRSLPPKDSQGTTRVREVGAILSLTTQSSPTTNEVQIAGLPNANQNEDNPTLFWVILGIVLILAFLFLMAVTYYCCPGLCKPCLGDGYLRKSLLPPGVHPMGTAKDLTFVSVLDKDGRPLRQASTVEVWNTKKNNIKTYPIINGSTDDKKEKKEGKDNLKVFTSQTGHLARNDFILTDDSEAVETGDHVTLVDKNGKESPVMVRILRAVTPRTFSARLARSRWKHSSPSVDEESNGEPPRIFEIVREQQPYPQHGGRQHPQDVQILTLDDAEADKRQTFRFEGSAEILELEHDQRQETGGTEVEEEVEEDLNRLPRQRQALEVLPEEAASEVEEDASSSPVLPPRNNSNLGGQKLRSVASSSPAASHAIQTSISSRATSSTSVDQASDMMRKISDHKEQQTDITYGHVNKKVQADTMNAEDQNSDIDHDDTDHSSVLSQSIRSTSNYDSTRFFRYKEAGQGPRNAEELGFLNVAMHHLVQDELQAKRGRSPKRRSRSQVDYLSDGSLSRKRSKKLWSDGNINYYDGKRTPSPTLYTETKASILRRRKNAQPNENEEEDLEEVLRPQYASLQDLSRLQHHSEGVPFSKHSSTLSLHHQNQRQPPQQPKKNFRRQNSEPLGVSI